MTSRPIATEVDSQMQLPIWPQDLRGLPNAFARSALFTVTNMRKGARTNMKRHKIAALQGIEIRYTGEELRQDDEDVFLQILHIARHQELGTAVRFTANSMITELGWTRNGASFSRLVDCIDRLKASALEITVSARGGVRESYNGSLIRSFRWREDGASQAPMRQWEVLLEREIISLFNPHSYSRLDWKMRLKLPALEKWLHSFYHTHAQPFPYKVETIHTLTGSEIPLKDLRKFRYKLKKALENLVEKGFFTSASIDPRTDLVHVERNRQHLSIVER
jgi:hypothetical protein